MSALADNPSIGVVKTVQKGSDLLPALHQFDPDLLLLDLNLPDYDGFTLLERIREINKRLRILIFTVYEDDALIQRARKLGANGYLAKNASPQEILIALDGIQAPEFYLSKKTQAVLAQKKNYNDQFVSQLRLTTRELQIIRELVKGKSSTEIADELFLSPLTIETHRKNILRKLGLGSTVELVTFAYENRLV